ncbi:MAG TPA: hypothetical protein VKD25_02510 [Burkholderiales bacterium]|nr:hypothetical protein [Burkholderiales bacterium]
MQRLRLSVISVALVAAGAASLCAAQAGLSPQTSGVGLRADSPSGGAPTVESLFAGDSPSLWQPKGSDFTLYGGARDLPAFGLGPAEAYTGVAYALPRGWGSSSLEAAYAQESRFAPRRYAVAGHVRTELDAPGRALSAGIKYRVYDTDVGTRGLEPTPLNGYSLAPSREPGYQLQFSYHHSPASSFGLALGRDVETYTSSFDPTSTAPRQLTFMGQHWLTPAWALSYDVLYNDPSNMSTLRLQGVGLRLGVRYRF